MFLKLNFDPLFINYLLFCILFSITHATVDAVLAFSSAELGTGLGSSAGFSLYIGYTVSALLFAKPVLNQLESKNSVLLGLTGLLLYVLSFFIAVWIPNISFVFIIGASLGGICGNVRYSILISFIFE
jgi:hypothetical protein